MEDLSIKQTIIVVGAISGDPPRSELLEKLAERDPTIDWQWLRAEASSPFPPENVVKKTIGKLRHSKCEDTTVVKLFMLDNKTASKFYQLKKLPVLAAPKTIDSITTLIEWIFSDDANLVPRREWLVNEREAALLAVLSKLLRRKYWNASVSGHEWLKEGPLINQSPVLRPGFQNVRVVAVQMLPRLVSVGLLLTKGSGQGKTPKEYSIHTRYLPEIKQAVCCLSLEPMLNQASLSDLMRSVTQHRSPRNINVLDGILNSIARANCRDSWGDE